MEKVKVLTKQSVEIKDDLLSSLNEKNIFEKGRMGIKGAAEIEDLDPDEPYDLEIVKPRAVDLKKLYRLGGKSVPNEIEAALGSQIPILVYHGFTPFHKEGANPRGVWGMGYEVKLQGLNEADTVSLVPSSETIKRGEIRSKVNVGVSLGGKMQVIPSVEKILNRIPGFNLQEAEVNMTTDSNFGLLIAINFSALKIQAGPIGAGGARWNIYRQQERIDLFQPLLQTLLIPSDLNRLKMSVKTWIRRSGKFGGLIGARAWEFKPVNFTVSLSGL